MGLELNKLINSRYILSRHIASGGMADIYEANDTINDRTVALKFLKPSFIDDDKYVEMFKNEMRFTAMFNHPHITKIYNIGEYEGRLFASYEYLKGKTLKETLDNRSRLSFDEAVDYLLQIVDAVRNMHEKEVLHNDIKPDNIIVLSDGNIKVGDLGIATHSFEKNENEIMGSLNYVAPEVLTNKKYSYQSDIYSIGIMFFEFLTGRVPYFGNDSKAIMEAHIKDDIPSIKKYISLNNADDIDYIIGKACNKIASNRYKNLDDFAYDLNKIKKHEKLKKGSIFTRLFQR